MGKLVNYVTPLHTATKRSYIDRMVDDKINCMIKAKEYEFDYWDGDRRICYGGYNYMEGRWEKVASSISGYYKLPEGAKILDIGCGKGYLLYDFLKVLPKAEKCSCCNTFIGRDFPAILRLIYTKHVNIFNMTGKYN